MIPDIIRCLHRISFGLVLDKSTMKIDFGNLPSLLRFREIADSIIEVFKRENILMYYCGTRSTFNTNVDIKLQLQFLDLDSAIPIPYEIIDCLSSGLFDNPIKNKRYLLLGYLGRTIDGDSRFVSGGLALEGTSHICLDMTTHSVVPVYTTGYRITHELLHTFGVTEEQEKGYDWRVYMKNASQITPFAQVVQNIIPDSISYMGKKVERIQQNNVALLNELWRIERELSNGDMGIQEQTQTSTEIYHPIFSVSTVTKGVPMFDQPIPDVKGFHIPFA